MRQSKLLTQIGIAHGYSSRNESREAFLRALGLTSQDIVMGEQVHGIRIATVHEKDKGKTLPGIDGLVSKGIPIGVTFADCVPILAVDPQARIVGAAHAGWKGTLAGIASALIDEMKKLGAQGNTIYISLGPRIGMCCYNVTDDRAAAFQKQFGADEKITARIDGEWHVDIGFANYQQLLEMGVPKDNIDAPPMCTSCQAAEFHSFRKNLPRRQAGPKDEFGVQLGVITV